MSRKMVGIQEAADFLGVCPQTLRRWERKGLLLPDGRTPGGRRRYDLEKLQSKQLRALETARRTVAYARVFSFEQKDDLKRQKQVLELYCMRQGWTFEVITDPDSGKKGLKRLINAILAGQVERLVITHKDRSAEPVFAICEAKNVEVVILNQGCRRSAADRPQNRH